MQPRISKPYPEVFATFAINPKTGKPHEVYVPVSRFERARELGRFAEIELHKIIPRILMCPKMILQGAKKLDDPDSLGYIGRMSSPTTIQANRSDHFMVLGMKSLSCW